MATLEEIERAAEALPPQEKQELILFLAERLREIQPVRPEPQALSREQIEQWIAQDEGELLRLRKP